MDCFFPPSFHPRIAPWFLKTYGNPTSIQAAAWPVIAEGRHVLALAPTGSGKTLAAFLDSISRFATGEYDAGALSVLYVSPLKALNEDIRRNLKEPLDSLRAWFEKEGEVFPGVRVETRSGDTPQSDRRRFLTHPPSILAPPITENILEGITRRTIIHLLREEIGVEVVERQIDRTEVYLAEEAFFCGTGVQIAPITRIDHRTLGSGQIGPIVNQLRQLYFNVVTGRAEKYRDWLTPVYQAVPAS